MNVLSRQCFVYFTRSLGKRECRDIARLVDDLRGIADVHVLSYQAAPGEVLPEYVPGTEVPVTVVTRSTLEAHFSNYPRKYHSGLDWRLMPGNTDLPQLAFYFLHPRYDYYWFSEDDVVYTGRMDELIRHFEPTEADLLATNWRRMPSRWYHRESLCIPERLLRDGWQPTICLMPLYRASRRFFDAVHNCYQLGLSGHYELTWPFVVQDANLVGCDFNDTGSTFYTSNLDSGTLAPGTFVYRPARACPGRRPNTLYHPVKPLREVLVYRLKAFYWRLLLRKRVSKAKKA